MQKFLIVGLGNIGEKYRYTRHNIGFLVADEIAAQAETAFVASRFGSIAQFKYRARPVTVLKPDTFMNLSGQAVKFWMQKENIPMQNLLIITDDLNLEFGQVRIRSKGSDGGHNGLKSVQQVLQTTQYPRLRFGIGDRFLQGQQVEYVLGQWTDEQMQSLPERVRFCTDAVYDFVFAGIDQVMNTYNGK
ncbi:MAG: aminoacyl-tRNA hydrolase [Weeksellaceae bacterium]|nr:aminoacyl-tRNA hydrolase [Weeksellaceae bacterium]